MTKDQIKLMLIEEIEKLQASEQIDEGFLDRLKAQAAGLKGTLGAGASNLAGKAMGALGAQGAASELQQAGAERAAGATEAKQASLLKSHATNIARAAASFQKTFDALNKDIQKIGISNPELAKQINTMRGETLKNMNGLISFLGSGGTKVATNAAKAAPAPAAAPEAPKAPEAAPQAPKAAPVQDQPAQTPAQQAAAAPKPRAPKAPAPQAAPQAPAAPAAPQQQRRPSARARR